MVGVGLAVWWMILMWPVFPSGGGAMFISRFVLGGYTQRSSASALALAFTLLERSASVMLDPLQVLPNKISDNGWP